MPRSTRLLALTVSAVLGLVGGVVGGRLLDHHTTGPDPLGLGVSLVNQPCTGKSLLVTTSGRSRPALASAVAEDPDQAHYLDIARSCPTAWRQGDSRPQGYATYLGPYSSVGDACQVRMTVAHRGDLVTRLKAGNKKPIQCLCYLDYATMPVLRQGMTIDARDGIYVFALQKVLATLGLNSRSHGTGLYDDATIEQIRAFQRANALPQNGVLDASTWHLLLGQGCKSYSE